MHPWLSILYLATRFRNNFLIIPKRKYVTSLFFSTLKSNVLSFDQLTFVVWKRNLIKFSQIQGKWSYVILQSREGFTPPPPLFSPTKRRVPGIRIACKGKHRLLYPPINSSLSNWHGINTEHITRSFRYTTGPNLCKYLFLIIASFFLPFFSRK